MKKKMAFVLVMVMLGNMIAWADDSTDSTTTSDAEAVAVFAIIGAGVLLGLLIAGIVALVSEADAPDDGIRLASMQTTTPVLNTGLGSSVFNFLQHIELGQTKNDNFYVGLHFRF